MKTCLLVKVVCVDIEILRNVQLRPPWPCRLARYRSKLTLEPLTNSVAVTYLLPLQPYAGRSAHNLRIVVDFIGIATIMLTAFV